MRPDVRAATRAAAVCAFSMIAWFVGAKAVRDTLFLQQFPVEWLPMMVIVASLLALTAVPGLSAWMARATPGRVVPRLFGISAGMAVGLWGLAALAPAAAAIGVYLYVVLLGASVISGFWSVVNERFDPRTGKRQVTRIVGAANLGGLAGGLLAERVGTLLGPEAMLPMLAVLHVVCAAAVLRVGRGVRPDSKVVQEDPRSGLALLRERPYLRSLALLVLLLGVASGLVDYLFKAAADANYDGEELMRFFAWFYAGLGLFTFLLQSTVARPALRALGLGRAAATYPALVGAGSVLTLLVPGLPAITALRSVDGAVRPTLFSSAYELLYVPLPRSEKRKTKAVVDVGVNRIGDALGGAAVAGLLLLPAAFGTPLMLVVAAVLCLLAVGVTLRLERSYVDVLERSLRHRAEELDLLSSDADPALQLALSRTLAVSDLRNLDPRKSQMLLSSVLRLSDVTARPETPAPVPRSVLPSGPGSPLADPVLARIAELRSRDPERIRAALQGLLGPEEVAFVVPLVAWDDVAKEALEALTRCLPLCTGQIVDAILDPDEAFTIRRRLPRALARAGDARAVPGMLACLSDPRFEVRYQAGRTLSRLARRHPDLVIPRGRVEEAVLEETRTERSVWLSRRLLDDVEDADSPLVDESIRDRVDRSLEHVFRLLTLIFPPEPLHLAFRGLHTEDPELQGTALEYLETVLPDSIRAGLWPWLAPEAALRKAAGAPEEALERLLASHHSIQLRLDALRAAQEAE